MSFGVAPKSREVVLAAAPDADDADAPLLNDVGGIDGVTPGTPPPEHLVPMIAQDVGSRLRSPACQGLSVADCTSEAAVLMQRRIHDLVAMGYTSQDIFAYFVSGYGEWVLLAPTREGLNWIVTKLEEKKAL